MSNEPNLKKYEDMNMAFQRVFSESPSKNLQSDDDMFLPKPKDT